MRGARDSIAAEPERRAIPSGKVFAIDTEG
jgi:hypothetical protein